MLCILLVYILNIPSYVFHLHETVTNSADKQSCSGEGIEPATLTSVSKVTISNMLTATVLHVLFTVLHVLFTVLHVLFTVLHVLFTVLHVLFPSFT